LIRFPSNAVCLQLNNSNRIISRDPWRPYVASRFNNESNVVRKSLFFFTNRLQKKRVTFQTCMERNKRKAVPRTWGGPGLVFISGWYGHRGGRVEKKLPIIIYKIEKKEMDTFLFYPRGKHRGGQCLAQGRFDMQLWGERGIEPGTSWLRVDRSPHENHLPPFWFLTLLLQNNLLLNEFCVCVVCNWPSHMDYTRSGHRNVRRPFVDCRFDTAVAISDYWITAVGKTHHILNEHWGHKLMFTKVINQKRCRLIFSSTSELLHAAGRSWALRHSLFHFTSPNVTILCGSLTSNSCNATTTTTTTTSEHQRAEYFGPVQFICKGEGPPMGF